MSQQLIGQLTAKAKSLEAELQQARMQIRGRSTNSGANKPWMQINPVVDQSKEEGEAWLATYLDMMTLLLVFMVVMLAFAGKSDDQSATSGQRSGGGATELQLVAEGDAGASATHPDEATDQDRLARLAELGLEGLDSDIDVLFGDDTISFRIDSEILFPSGQADLGLSGVNVLQSLVKVLKRNDFQVAVEGHTDSVPIRSTRFPSNWELSSSRAGSVVRYLEANGIASQRLRAVGYADTQNLSSNDTAQGRAQNRRVELTMDVPATAP